MTPNTRTLKGQSYCSQRWANPAWPKGSKSRGFSSTRKYAYNAINIALVQRNWLLGKRIAEEELQGENRAKYGEEIIETLSKELTKIYGKGFDYSSLYKYSKFYKLFPEILDSLSPESYPILSWTHYRVLLQVENNDARNWYMKEAAQQT